MWPQTSAAILFWVCDRGKQEYLRKCYDLFFLILENIINWFIYLKKIHNLKLYKPDTQQNTLNFCNILNAKTKIVLKRTLIHFGAQILKIKMLNLFGCVSFFFFLQPSWSIKVKLWTFLVELSDQQFSNTFQFKGIMPTKVLKITNFCSSNLQVKH